MRRVGGRPVRIIDPACGDGRFLRVVRSAVEQLGGTVDAVGVDIDTATCSALAREEDWIDVRCTDALAASWELDAGSFDLVVGNPPFLSQLAADTTRGGASEHGGGPYADAAAEFLALGVRLVRPDGGRLAYVLPQSILAARDAQAVRADIDARARLLWSTWTGERDFEAHVVTCALAFEFDAAPTGGDRALGSWSHVVTSRTGVPPMPKRFEADPAAGRLGDRAWLNANFRDEYYGMAAAVGDHHSGPRLVTSGLIAPGRMRWGQRSVRFAKQRFDAPRLDLDALDDKMSAWANKRLVPKVLVANQTPVVEAVCDPDGDCLPGVPVVAIYPSLAADPAPGSIPDVCWEIAAVLCAPSVSVWAWHRRGGSGLSAGAIRVSPGLLAELAWPAGDLSPAVTALQAGDVIEAGRLADVAYRHEVSERDACVEWWAPLVSQVLARP